MQAKLFTYNGLASPACMTPPRNPLAAPGSESGAHDGDGGQDLPAKAPEWTPDKAVKECQGCEAGFSMFNRKHHCRACGGVFCNDCTQFRSPIPVYGIFDRVRVCKQCVSRYSSLTSPAPFGSPNGSVARSPAPRSAARRADTPPPPPDSAMGTPKGRRGPSGREDEPGMTPPPSVKRVTRDTRQQLVFFQSKSGMDDEAAEAAEAAAGGDAASVDPDRDECASVLSAAASIGLCDEPEPVADDARSIMTATTGAGGARGGASPRRRVPLFKSPAHRRMAKRLSAESAPLWVPDQFISECQRCNSEFGVFLRKHHCRVCGRIYCDACTDMVAVDVKQDTKLKDRVERVCYVCLEEAEVEFSIEEAASARAQEASFASTARIATGAGAAEDGGEHVRRALQFGAAGAEVSTTAGAGAGAGGAATARSLTTLPISMLAQVSAFLEDSGLCALQATSAALRRRMTTGMTGETMWRARATARAAARMSESSLSAAAGLIRNIADNQADAKVQAAMDAMEDGFAGLLEAASGKESAAMRRMFLVTGALPTGPRQALDVLCDAVHGPAGACESSEAAEAEDTDAADAARALQITPRVAMAAWVTMHDVHAAVDAGGDRGRIALDAVGVNGFIRLLRGITAAVDEPASLAAPASAADAAAVATAHATAATSPVVAAPEDADGAVGDSVDADDDDASSEGAHSPCDPVMDCFEAEAEDEEEEADADVGGEGESETKEEGEVEAEVKAVAGVDNSGAATAAPGACTPKAPAPSPPGAITVPRAVVRPAHQVAALMPRPALVAAVAAAGSLMNLAQLRLPADVNLAAVTKPLLEVLESRVAYMFNHAATAASSHSAPGVAKAEAALFAKLVQYSAGALWNLSNTRKETCDTVGASQGVHMLLTLMRYAHVLAGSKGASLDGFVPACSPDCFGEFSHDNSDPVARTQLYAAGTLTNVWKTNVEYRGQLLACEGGMRTLLRAFTAGTAAASTIAGRATTAPKATGAPTPATAAAMAPTAVEPPAPPAMAAPAKPAGTPVRTATTPSKAAAGTAGGAGATPASAGKDASPARMLKDRRRRRLSATPRRHDEPAGGGAAPHGGNMATSSARLTLMVRTRRQAAQALRECVKGCAQVCVLLREEQGLSALAQATASSDRQIAEAAAGALQDCTYQDAPARAALISCKGVPQLACVLEACSTRGGAKKAKMCAGIIMNVCASGPDLRELVGGDVDKAKTLVRQLLKPLQDLTADVAQKATAGSWADSPARAKGFGGAAKLQSASPGMVVVAGADATGKAATPRDAKTIVAQLQVSEFCCGSLVNLVTLPANAEVVRTVGGEAIMCHALLCLPSSGNGRKGASENLPGHMMDGVDFNATRAVQRAIWDAVHSATDRSKQRSKIRYVRQLADQVRIVLAGGAVAPPPVPSPAPRRARSSRTPRALGFA